MRGDADVGRARFQRQWDARAYAQYLTAAGRGEDDADPYGSVLRPQVEAIVRAVFRALEAEPSSLVSPMLNSGRGRWFGSSRELRVGPQLESNAGRSRSKLKRFGLDLLVDEDFRVWLIGRP